MKLVDSAAERVRICEQTLRALPLWFGIESALKQYVQDAERMEMLAAFDGDRAAGFVALNRHNEFTAEVHVMAVHPDFHRQGIGRALVAECEARLRTAGFRFLTVKTLSPAKPNREYDQTRAFYFALGFRPIEEFKTLWGAENPCLLMLKAL